MLLCVDVGNTQTVLATFDGTELVHSWRIRTDSRLTADELALTFRGLLSVDGLRITGISACSTVPGVLRELKAMLARYYDGVPTLVVEPGIRTGVPLRVDNPREVGADRVVNTLAAAHLYDGPTIVVDFGTSTNFDVVSPAGEFLGGALAPGVEISVDALASRAAQLLKVQLTPPRGVIGKNTVEALQSGILYGFAGQVDGIVDRIRRSYEPAIETVVATGGLSGLIVPESRTITHHEPALTLIGLRLVYERNQA